MSRVGMRWGRTVTAAAIAAGVLAVGEPAQAATGWAPYTDVSSESLSVNNLDVDANHSGSSALTWLRHTAGSPDTRVQVAVRMVGHATWEFAELASNGLNPAVAVDDAGYVLVAWRANGKLLAAVRSPDGAWSPPTEISASDPSTLEAEPLPGQGFEIVWAEAGVGAWARALPVPAGPWSPATLIRPVSALASVDVWDYTVNPGARYAAIETHLGGTWTMVAAIASHGAGWTATDLDTFVYTGPAGDRFGPRIAANATGTAVFTWPEESSTFENVVYARVRNAGTGLWGPIAPLTPTVASAYAEEAQPVVDQAGNATILISWSPAFGTPTEIRASHRGAASPGWTDLPSITTNAGSVPPLVDLEIDVHGDRIASWAGSMSGTFGYFAAVLPPDNSAWNVTGQPGTFFIGEAAMDGAGNLVAGANRQDPTSGTYAAALVFDRATPVVDPLLPSGHTNELLAFDARTWDQGTPRPAIAWDFGDGTTGSGAITTHAYATPGLYQVTVTATDGVGNSRQAMGGVAVSAPDGVQFTCPPTAPATPFTDIEGSFASEQIACLYGAGIVAGTSSTTYSPGAPVTREQMAIFLMKAWEAGAGRAYDGPTMNPFTDIAGSFALPRITQIAGLGVTAGCTTTTYCPTATVTRDQMAVFLIRLATASGGVPDAPTTNPFTDVAGNFAETEILQLVELGVTAGTSATTYSPAAAVTREQMAVFVARLLEVVTQD